MVKAKSSRRSGNVMIPSHTTSDRTILSPSNPRVKVIAFRFRWGVDTVMKRVENALPSKIEQTLYLQVAAAYRIHPESLKKMLEIFRGEEGLKESDMKRVPVGPNMFKSKFDDVLEKIEYTLTLIDKTSDAANYMLSMESAARLVEAYGGYAEDILSCIIENPLDAARQLGIGRVYSSRIVVGVAVKVLLQAIDDRGNNGQPLPLTMEDMFVHQKRGKFHE